MDLKKFKKSKPVLSADLYGDTQSSPNVHLGYVSSMAVHQDQMLIVKQRLIRLLYVLYIIVILVDFKVIFYGI